MLINRIAGATRIMGADQDEFRNLPIRDKLIDGVNYMGSSWQPTPDELERLNQGAAVYLTIQGERHPPVILTVGKMPTEEANT